jgi:hypothetical protein
MPDARLRQLLRSELCRRAGQNICLLEMVLRLLCLLVCGVLPAATMLARAPSTGCL